MSEVWTTKLGEELNPEDMSTEHIINCLKQLKQYNFIDRQPSNYVGGTFSGEMADYYACQDADLTCGKTYSPMFKIFYAILESRGINIEELDLNAPKRKSVGNMELNSTSIWTTQNGREIPIKDMETEHIINTIRMLKRNGYSEHDHRAALWINLDMVSDSAAMCLEQEQELAWQCPYSPWFKAFFDELADRGIDRKTANVMLNEPIRV
jgi:hypothetical protein